MKRLISLILALAMLLSLAPAVFAEETQTTAGATLEFGTPEEKTATEYNNQDNTVKYYEIPVIFKNNTSESIILTAVECHINYDALGLETVDVKTGSGLSDKIQAVSCGEHLTAWGAKQTTSDGLIKVIGATAETDYFMTVESGSEAELFKLNLKAVNGVENGDYRLAFAEPYDSVDGVKCNLVAYDYNDVVKPYSQKDGTLDCSSTATITVTDGELPILDHVTITPNEEATYGVEKPYILTAYSDKSRDITNLVEWEMPGSYISLGDDGKTVRTSEETPAGTYTITAKPQSGKCTGTDVNPTCTLTVGKAKIENVELTLNGYGKGQSIEGATITGAGVKTELVWYEAETNTEATGTFKANTAYKVKVWFTPANDNYEFAENAKAVLGGVEQTISANNVPDYGWQYTSEFVLEKTNALDKPELTVNGKLSATYGQKLNEISITGVTASFNESTVEGNFAWQSDGDYVGSVGDNAHTVVFEPTNAAIFEKTTTSVTVAVTQANIDNANLAETISAQSYTGAAIEPKPVLKYKDLTLVEDADYTLTYDKNVDVSGTEPTIIVTGKTNFTGTKNIPFTIQKAARTLTLTLTPATITYGDKVKYSVNIEGTTVKYRADNESATEQTLTENTILPIGTYFVWAELDETVSYEWTKSSEATLTVNPAPINPSVTLNGWTYGGTANEPEVTNNPGNGNVTYSYNTENGQQPTAAGKYTVTATIEASGNYAGATCSSEFTIAKKQIKAVVNATVSPITKWYDGENIALAHFKLEDGSVVGEDDVQIANADSVRVTFSDPYVGENKTVTIEKLELTGDDAGNYELIQPTGLTGSITAPQRRLTTTTSEAEPATLTKGGKELDLKTLVETNAPSKDGVTFECTSLPEGCTLENGVLKSGNTSGEPFAITVKGAEVDLNNDKTPEFNAATDITIYVKIVDKREAGLSVTAIPAKMIYGNEKSWTSSVTCSDKSGKTVATSDNEKAIKVKEDGTLLAVGVGTAKVTFVYETAEYYGSKSYTIEVEARTISITADDKEIVYGENDPELTFKLTDVTNRLVNGDTLDDLHITASIEGTDRSAGTHTIKLAQTEQNKNYTVELKNGTLTITKAPLTIKSAAVEGVKYYDGKTDIKVLTVTLDGLKNDDKLVKDTDYTATGAFNDANAGNNKPVTVTVTLNETDLAKNYTISGTYSDATSSILKKNTPFEFKTTDAVYTGQPYDQSNITVTTESQGKQTFKFFADNNNYPGNEIDRPTDVGTYWVGLRIPGTQNESGVESNVKFSITPRPLTDEGFAFEIPDQTYTGSAIEPAVTVNFNGKPLTAGTDYDVSYENNTNVSETAKVTITGKGNFSGEITKTFNITAQPVTNAEVTVADTALVYDKMEKKPTVTVKVGTVTLTEGTDYTVAYSNNVNAGTATATVTFEGNYSGTATGTFTIAPKPVGINWTGDTFFYDKTEKTVTAAAADTDVVEGDTVNVTVKGGKQTAIGTYIATATALDNTNYTLPTTGLTQSFTIKNAIESISVVSPKTVSATVDGLTIKLVGTKKDNESISLRINNSENTVTITNDQTSVDFAGITYKLDKSNLTETPNDVTLAEKPAAVPNAPENASDDLKQAVAAVKSEGGPTSEGLAAAAAAAVTDEAAKKNTSEENKEVKADVKLEIEVKDYEKTADKSVLTLEITPQVTYTYTDKEGEKQEETKTISNNDIKAPVTISIKLPTDMSLTDIFVKHGDEYIKPIVDEEDHTITWEQSSFSPTVVMSYPGKISFTLELDDGSKIEYTDLDASSIGTVLPKDGTKTNWQFDGIEGSYSTITKELFDKLAEKGTVTAKSVSGSSSDSDSKPSKPGNSSSGPLLPSLGDDELTFRDVSKYDYYYNAVKWAVKKGVTSGTGRYTFSPDDACTRAQTVTFLWRAAGCPKASTKANPFTDVSASDYFYEAVLWAVENGITNGTSSTTFSPNASVTRAQVATFLWRANGEPAAKDSGFTDVSANAYYAKAVAWAYAEGITTGTGFGVFSPEAICTRAQIVTFLFRNAK